MLYNFFSILQPLKRALERMGVSNLISDKFDNSLSFLVMSQLKKMKNQAKVEYEKVCAEVSFPFWSFGTFEWKSFQGFLIYNHVLIWILFTKLRPNSHRTHIISLMSSSNFQPIILNPHQLKVLHF